MAALAPARPLASSLPIPASPVVHVNRAWFGPAVLGISPAQRPPAASQNQKTTMVFTVLVASSRHSSPGYASSPRTHWQRRFPPPSARPPPLPRGLRYKTKRSVRFHSEVGWRIPLRLRTAPSKPLVADSCPPRQARVIHTCSHSPFPPAVAGLQSERHAIAPLHALDSRGSNLTSPFPAWC